MVNSSFVCEKRQLPSQTGVLMQVSFWVQLRLILEPIWPVFVFSMKEAQREKKDMVKNSSSKEERVIVMNANTHTLDSQGYPSVIQEHDTEIRGRLSWVVEI